MMKKKIMAVIFIGSQCGLLWGAEKLKQLKPFLQDGFEPVFLSWEETREASPLEEFEKTLNPVDKDTIEGVSFLSSTHSFSAPSLESREKYQTPVAPPEKNERERGGFSSSAQRFPAAPLDFFEEQEKIRAPREENERPGFLSNPSSSFRTPLSQDEVVRMAAYLLVQLQGPKNPRVSDRPDYSYCPRCEVSFCYRDSTDGRHKKRKEGCDGYLNDSERQTLSKR
jgi:hypothetical protein